MYYENSFNLNVIMRKLESLAGYSSIELTRAFSELNGESALTNPQKTTAIQFKLGQYTNFISWQSNCVKSIRDLVSGIIGKM